MRSQFGASAESIQCRRCCKAASMGFMVLPIYRAWVILASITVCT